MTYEEAKEAIVNPQTVLMVAAVRYGKKHAQEVCKKVLEALDKQIAVKPMPYPHYEGQCPTCKAVFEDRLTKHCGNCGQALDWGQE